MFVVRYGVSLDRARALLVIAGLLLGPGGSAAETIGQFDADPVNPVDEARIFTPPGFKNVGQLANIGDKPHGRLRVTVRDRATGGPTFCRVNVVGSDGNFYQPEPDIYTPHNLNVAWPEGRGNRASKGPFRYFGKYFYTRGAFKVAVPLGTARVEVWKGFEYAPQTKTVEIRVNETSQLELTIDRTLSMTAHNYWDGDPHLHFDRLSEEDDELLFDLLEAEDISIGGVLTWNNNTVEYFGSMDALTNPQRALGERSTKSRGDFSITSGQEYRGKNYGHMNLFMFDHLLLPGQKQFVDHWPVYGELARAVIEQGGFAFYAHGGYAQEIYADVVQGNIQAVELLQFAKYRGIGLEGWYHVLNAGLRLPAFGACDFDACRKLGDCRTYVYHEGQPNVREWFEGLASGRSIMTTGPMLLLEVDGSRPGATITKASGDSLDVDVHVRARSEVSPIRHFEIIVNGEIVHREGIPQDEQQRSWFERQKTLELDGPSWIAARVYALAPTGSPNSDAHTNPVFVNVNGEAPYVETDARWLLERLDEQIRFHEQRTFKNQHLTVAYFKRSRDMVQDSIDRGHMPADGTDADGHPSSPAPDGRLE